MTAGDRLLAEARRLVGTPWRHMGRTPEGLDCVGLVLLAARRAGFPEALCAEPPPYSRHSAGPRFLAALAERFPGGRVGRDALLPGDVLTFSETQFPAHVGIAAGGGRVLHAYLPRRRVVEEPVSEDLLRGLRACFRPPAP